MLFAKKYSYNSPDSLQQQGSRLFVREFPTSLHLLLYYLSSASFRQLDCGESLVVSKAILSWTSAPSLFILLAIKAAIFAISR